MFRKVKFKTLIIVFIVLLVIVVIVEIVDYRKGDRTFRSDLVNIDTSKVSSVFLYPKAENYNEIKIFRSHGGWKIENMGKTFNADENVVYNMLDELIRLKPERVAAADKSKWEDFEVTDSTGVRIKVVEKNSIVADIIIGKFSYQQPQNPYQQRQGKMTSYVRLVNETKVYAVDGFLNMIFNRDVNTFRNKNLIESNKNNWTKLTFSYPADSSFVLIRQNDKWMSSGLLADSAQTDSYLYSIARLNSSDFVDETNSIILINELFSLMIEGNNLPAPIEIKAFSADTLNKYIITSSENSGSNFSGAKRDLFNKIFVPQSHFFPEN